jgi:hypothetical protein
MTKPIPNERLLSDSLAESCRFMSQGTRVSAPRRKQHGRWVDVLGWVVVVGVAIGYIAGAAGQ